MKGKNVVLSVFLLLEIIFLFFTKDYVTLTVNATCFFFSSVLFGIAIIAFFYKKSTTLNTVPLSFNGHKKKIIILLTVVSLVVLIPLQGMIFHQYPIAADKSDIIPLISIMVKRWLSGSYVYAPSYDLGYLLSPTYLPLQWLPYTIAEVLHFDYRWISQLIWVIAFIILMSRVLKIDNFYLKLLVFVITYLLYYTIYDRERPMYVNTVEIMIAGYYMLFIMALNTHKVIYIAFAFTACILSRYSLILWMPLWAFVMWSSAQRKEMFKIMGITAVLVLLIYVVPFLSHDWHSFGRSIEHYTRAAVGEWQHLDERGLPCSIYNGVGFAHLFYEMKGVDINTKIASLQKLDFILCISISFILGVWYWFNKDKIDYRIFLMGSFKIYLAVFLAFIQVPYIYLMVVSIFVSIAIFAEQLRYKITSYSPSL